MSTERKSRVDIVEEAALAGGAYLIAQKTGADPVLSAVVISIGTNVGKEIIRDGSELVSDLANGLKRRYDWFWKALSDRRGVSEQEAKQSVAAILNDEGNADKASRVFRAVAEAPQMASVDALAALLDLYAKPENGADAFFRSAVRMLADCDTYDLKDLCATIAAIRDSLGVFPGRVFITANAPDSVGNKRSRDPKNPTLAEPKTLLVSDGTNARRSIDGKGARVAASGATIGKGGGAVAGVPYDRAIQVVQRLGAVGIGLPRTENGAESVAVLNGTLHRLAYVLGVEITDTKA